MTLSSNADNRVFTYQYHQPKDYHFCQDSVLFPKFVAGLLNTREIPPGFRALDLCAGCGVVGFELAFHEPRIEQMDFLELQEIFRESFMANLEITAKSPEKFRFIQANFSELSESDRAGRYDLIIANPPYFMPGEGRLSSSNVQNRCRFFLDGNQKTLIDGVINALKPETGEAFLLVKSGERHGRRNARDLALWLAGRARMEIVAEISNRAQRTRYESAPSKGAAIAAFGS